MSGRQAQALGMDLAQLLGQCAYIFWMELL